MKVCYISTYGRDYSRNIILRKGLEMNSVDVVDCSYESKSFLLRHVGAFFKFLKLKKDCDIVLVGFYGQVMIFFVKMFTKKKIVLDAFFSTYNTIVEDKGKAKGFGKILYYLDKKACEKADMVLLDTNEHINYFCKTFGLQRYKFRRIFIGTDPEIFFPREKNKEFSVVFYGKYIPFYSMKTIIYAASMLKDVDFKLIGRGQTFKEDYEYAKNLGVDNISFVDRVPIEELGKEISNGDVGLGIFGESKKAKMVIPNKIYDVLACKRVLVTADTPAVRELLDEDSAVLVPPRDSKALADAIVKLKDNVIRDRIAAKGYEVYLKNGTPNVLGKELKKCLEEVYS